MAEPVKPWKAEYAKSGRSSFRTCKTPIDKEVFRLGKMVQSSQFDGFMPMWNHAHCILKKAKQIKSLDDVYGIESLRWEDQQKIRNYVDSSGLQITEKSTTPSIMQCGIEVSQTSRATCKCCNQKIMKGEVRISTKPEGQGARGLAWNHANCFLDSSPTTEVQTLSGWDSLSASDQTVVSSMVKKVPSISKGKKNEVDKEPAEDLMSKGGAKRKRAVNGNEKSTMVKAEGEQTSKTSRKNTINSGDHDTKASDLESQMEAQTKELWALKDNLKNHVTTAELRQMLEVNNQDSSGSELVLRDRCADQMLFGTLARCPLCSSCFRFTGGTYKCIGYLSAWSKCAYSTTEPERVKGKWDIPEGTSNQYLLKWFKSQKAKKPSRVLPPQSASAPSGSQVVKGSPQLSKSENLGDLKVSIAGVPVETMDEWKSKLESIGGQVHAKIKKDTNCFVVSGVLDKENAETRKARRMKLPIVRDEYLVDCFKRQRKLPFDLYKVEATGEGSSMVTVKVKGRVLCMNHLACKILDIS